uniref:Uncharacterized protein n=1 Tax=Utricularia reniformis TaxID=192314 RepID=A0A1Y0B0E8_9LAMI|nr:hypothetical protein AEK19_MT0599 [Utricularia reniformis]ART30854.1 hypothetical protein AEK19_MT0599 [Utricularia reniformis]
MPILQEVTISSEQEELDSAALAKRGNMLGGYQIHGYLAEPTISNIALFEFPSLITTASFCGTFPPRVITADLRLLILLFQEELDLPTFTISCSFSYVLSFFHEEPPILC